MIPATSLFIAKRLLAFCLLGMAAVACSAGAGVDTAVTITVASARNRKLTATSKPYLAKVRGIVTAFSGWKNSFFLQDDTGAISVDRLEQTPLKTGDEVEVTGAICAGRFAPILLSDSIHVIGGRTLPEPRVATYHDLWRGTLDSQRVEVKGLVRSADIREIWGRQVLFLELRTIEKGSITVQVIDFPSNFDKLIDSTVSVRGVCGTVFNDREQLIGLRVFVPSLNDIQVESKPVELFRLPLSPLDDLLKFNPDASLDHRVRISGTVTFQVPGVELYLQHANAGVRVETQQQGTFQPGTEVEASGFVVTDGYSPGLESASVRVIGSGIAPPPVRVEAAQVITERDGFGSAPFNGVLVHIKGKLIERLPQTHDQLWLLEDKQVQFQAELRQIGASHVRIEPGSFVALTGICRTEVDSRHNPKSFRILLRSAQDIAVLRTSYSTISVSFVVITLTLIAGGGILILLFQKRLGVGDSQSDEIAFQSRKSAVLPRVSRVIAMLIGSLGALVLLGWGVGSTFLKSIRSDYPSMKANTALAFLTAGIALWLENKNDGRGRGALGHFFSVVTAALGGLNLLEYITGWNLHIDELLFSEVGPLLATSSPGRMALITAFCFFVLGVALVVVRRPRVTTFAQASALLTGAFCLLSLNCYLYGIHHFEGVAVYAATALHTAIGLLLLSLGVLFCCPTRGPMRSILSPAPGGVMAVRMLPCVLLLSPLLGWLRLQGQLQGFYDTAFGVALLTSANIVCFCFLSWSTASLLNRLDQGRAQAETEVRSLNESLETRVAQRTAELHESELGFRSMIHAVKDYSIMTLDPSGNVATWNSGTERQKGYAAEEILGKHFSMFYPREDLEHDLPDKELQVAESSGECRNEGWRVRKDGELFWVDELITAVRNEDGKLRGFSTISHDITARKKTERSLREQGLLLDLANDTIFIRNSEDQITYWNQGAERLYGWNKKEALGQVAHKLLETKFPRPLSEIEAQLVETGHWEGELVHARRDGALLTVASSWTLERDESSRSISVLELGHDITVRKLIERHVVERTAQLRAMNKELEQYAYIASHDLKAPLRVINNVSKWLEKDLQGNLTDKVRENLNLLRSRVRRMDKLLDDLLDYARIGRSTDNRFSETIDGDTLMRNILGLLAPADLTIRVSPSFTGIQVCRMPLQQILLNLIGNAIKHHDKKTGNIEVTVTDTGDSYTFAVKDDGPGIAPEYHDQVFKMFQTLKPRDQVEGSGMGLAMVRKNIEVFGGTLQLVSAEGEGSTFQFTWPKRQQLIRKVA